MLIKLKLEHLCKSDKLEVELAFTEVFASLSHDLLPMALFNSSMVKLGDLRNRI
jgi:hypothetical protein